MKSVTGFRLADGTTPTDLEAALAEVFHLVGDGSCSVSWRIFDTFDWRLYNRSQMLRHSGSELCLVSLKGDEILACDAGASGTLFVHDLPAGELRDALQPVVEPRALLELACVVVDRTDYRMLNERGKTVARLAFLETQARTGPNPESQAAYLSIRPVRGYEKQARRLAGHRAFGSPVKSIDKAIYLSALQAAGRMPNDYTNQLDVHLVPAMRADEAAKAILRRLLDAMRVNEPGIRADIDSEFLHDYRVAVRRTRSALGQIPGVFPAETTERFKQDFRVLGGLTNELRDLDVYLLAEPDYRAMLPDVMRDDIGPLFALLRARRVEALDHVIRGLDDQRYLQLLSDWEAFLAGQADDDPSAPNAGVPVVTLARDRIYRRYRRIVKDGTYILDHTEDELLHALRLQCKRLRYLLEFFASLFPSGQVKGMVGQLKRLQDNLGEFSDLEVQQQFLLSVADALDLAQPGTRQALVATGFLVDGMARKQHHVKSHFASAFREFASPAQAKQYRKLFAGVEQRR